MGVTRASLVTEAREDMALAIATRDVKSAEGAAVLLRALGEDRCTEQDVVAIRMIAEADAVPTALYRHYGQSEELLYVGISLKAVTRTMQHRNRAPWYMRIARIELQWFGSRSLAEVAEQKAIVAERPLHNITFNRRKSNARAPKRKARALLPAS